MASDVQAKEKRLTDVPDIIMAESWHPQIRRGSITDSHTKDPQSRHLES